MGVNELIFEINSRMDEDRKSFVQSVRDSIEYFEESQACMNEKKMLFILKVFNLLVAKYEYRHSCKKLLSRPFHIELDPSNACQLFCPGCIHPSSGKISQGILWDSHFMRRELFEDFMNSYGPYCFGANFYNYGEPFLNKQIYNMIKYARQFGMSILISSNLSIPIDAEAIVESHLDSLICSIDGATQKTYEIYRRGGNLKIVEDNIKKISRIKAETGATSPNIIWQFLTFEHNIHEIDLAKKLAEDWGCNQLLIATPHSVQWAAPEIKEINTRDAGWYSLNGDAGNGLIKNKEQAWNDLNFVGIKKEYNAFKERLREYCESNDTIEQQNEKSYCVWWYQAVVLDANGRFLPCCLAPTERNKGKEILAVWGETNGKGEVYNSSAYQDIRSGKLQLDHCSGCGNRHSVHYNLRAIKNDLRSLSMYSDLSQDSINCITEW